MMAAMERLGARGGPKELRPKLRRSLRILTLALIAALYFGGGFERFELAVTDLSFQGARRAASGEIILVEIDADSLQRLQVWPWPRQWHAEALQRLLDAGARQVAFDVDFSSRSSAEGDDALADALAAAEGRVIVPAFLQRGRRESDALTATVPLPDFARSARLGGVTVQPDADSRVRRLASELEIAGQRLPSLPLVLLGERSRVDRASFTIDFGVDPTTIPRISYADLLQDPTALRQVAGKDVLIGATAVELGDQLPVPVYRVLPGPVVLALAYETALQGRGLVRTGALPSLLGAAALIALVGPLFARLSWRRGLAAAVAACIACLALHHLLHAGLAVSLDLGPWLAAILLCYAQATLLLIDMQAKRIFRQHMVEAHRSALMKGVVENSFDAILAADASGRVRFANGAAARLFDLAPEGPAGRSLADFVRLPSGESIVTLLGAEAEADAIEPFEVVGLREGREAFAGELALRRATLFLSRHPLERRTTPRILWVATVRDVTERRKAEAAQAEARRAAEQANRAKTEFLATMSHELRTPLNAVLGFSEMIRDELLGPVGQQQYKAYAGDIHRSGAHLLEIVNDILDTAKIEAGKLTLSEEEVGLAAVVEATLQLARCRPEGGQAPITAALADGMPALWADRRLLKQILLNLVSNALKFTPSGEVRVSACLAADGWLELAVQDTGIGMAEDQIAKVRQPFYQVDSSHTRQYQGTGLGLSLVHSLVELHGGELRIESRLGHGTAVTCRFPPQRVLALPADRAAQMRA